jgi:hypothetical protein
MFRSLLTDIARRDRCFPAGMALRSVTRAASLAALTVLMVGTLSSAAEAQRFTPVPGTILSPLQPVTTTPLRLYFTRLYCHDVSNDNTFPKPDRDEPYVVVFAADLRGSTAAGRVFNSQVFGDVAANQLRETNLQVWSLNGNGAPINSSQDVIFLAALMESDNSNNWVAVRDKLSSILIPKLQSYKAAGMSYGQMVGNLRIDMDLALDKARATHQDEDDRVGGLTEVFFSAPGQLERARSGIAVYETRDFQGSDSRYTLTFRLQ